MSLVVIDPGHGGSDSGAVSGSYREKDFNLKIALKARDYLLNHYHVSVMMTRTSDTTISLSKRTDIANQNAADYFCSIHINAGGGTGWESYIYNGTVSSITLKAQDIIHATVMDAIGSKYGVRDRGQKRANFHVVRETRMPAILLENLFIDTSRDLNLLRNNSFIQDLGQAIGLGIAKALNLSKKDAKYYKVIAGSFRNLSNARDREAYLESNKIQSLIVQVEVDGQTYYRVQAGAFQSKQNAEARLAEVKKLTISDVYILYE
ncbi:MAG: N-acetylmuramoyl-L-alanine amidase [Firmicutes bacterium]|nr:N-acetylmuramoyl-L-alanine amidase [Bacillota bacterium]